MASIQIDIKDGLSSSVAVKGPCRVATTANITLSGEQTIDGVAVVTDDRVLVKDQTTGSENGIYVVDTGAWRRSRDFNKTKDIKTGTMVNVVSGSVGAGWWQVTTTGDITVGTTSIAFATTVLLASQFIDEDDMASNSATKVPSQQSVKAYVDGKTPFSVRTYGAVGDGTTDDTAAIQAALNAVKAAGGGTLYFPRTSAFYKITSGLTYDFSATSDRFLGRLWIKGDGSATSIIKLEGVAATALSVLGNTTYELYLKIEGLQITGGTGAPTAGSTGLFMSNGGWSHLEDVIIEAFDYNLDCEDVEQSQFFNCNFRRGNHGFRFATGAATSPNTLLFSNCLIAGNLVWGWQITNANSVTFVSGSTQYNGTTGGGATQWGGKITEAGNGYGNVLFLGHVFEGNGGVSDFISEQSTYVGAYKFVGVGFTRPNNISYATNFLLLNGSTATTYSLSGCTLRGYNTYVANAARPYFAIGNSSALIFDDGSNVYGSATEWPTWAGTTRIPTSANVGPGAVQIGTFNARSGTDRNFYTGGNVNLADGVVIGSVNDAGNTFKGLEVRASSVLVSSPVSATSAAIGAVATLESTAAGASSGPNIDLYRNIISANNNVISALRWLFKSAVAGTQRVGATIYNQVITATDGNETVNTFFTTMVNGVNAARMTLGAGLGVGGGDAGAGTVNASTGYYVNGVLIADATKIVSAGSGGIGYTTGAGGAVTQITSRTTGVTLNKASGAITMFTAAGSATPASFTVTNSTVAATDTIILNIKSGATNTYFYFVTAVAAGSFVVTFWTTGGTASDTPVVNFDVIKGVTS